MAPIYAPLRSCLSQFFIYFRCAFFFAQCFPPASPQKFGQIRDENSRNGDETLMTSNICVRVLRNFLCLPFSAYFVEKKLSAAPEKV